MSRYTLQQKVGGEWLDQEGNFSTKKQLEDYIGCYVEDFDWRCGYLFKRYDCLYMERFVYTKTGEDVKV